MLAASLKFRRPLTFKLLLILAEEEVGDKLAVAELSNAADPQCTFLVPHNVEHHDVFILIVAAAVERLAEPVCLPRMSAAPLPMSLKWLSCLRGPKPCFRSR
jgi:hypothetical protein